MSDTATTHTIADLANLLSSPRYSASMEYEDITQVIEHPNGRVTLLTLEGYEVTFEEDAVLTQYADYYTADGLDGVGEEMTVTILLFTQTTFPEANNA